MATKIRNEEINIKIGQPTEVSLKSNAKATGYVWFVTHSPDILWLGDIAYIAPESPEREKVWKKIFTFIGGKQGQDYLEFSLARYWKPKEIVKKLIYKVNVS